MAQRPERYVTNKEMWNSLDEDTKSFVSALMKKQMIMRPDKDHPSAGLIEISVAITVRAIKTTELIWIEGHPKCAPKK